MVGGEQLQCVRSIGGVERVQAIGTWYTRVNNCGCGEGTKSAPKTVAKNGEAVQIRFFSTCSEMPISNPVHIIVKNDTPTPFLTA